MTTGAFSDIQLGTAGLRLPSRVCFAPINPGFGPSPLGLTKLRAFHAIRSSPALGVNWVGNVVVAPELAASPRALVLATLKDATTLKPIAEGVAQRGSVPGIQLAASPSQLRPDRKWKPADTTVELTRLRNIVSEASAAALDDLLQHFVVSAQLATQEAGFRVVQIHAAHGYALSLLFHGVTNVRTDRYVAGGAWIGDFAARIVEAIRPAPACFRLNLRSGVGTSQELDEVGQIAESLAKSGVQAIDFSAGLYTLTRQLIYPHRRKGTLPDLDAVRAVAPEGVVVGVVGNVFDVADTSVPDHFLINVGRALIADPLFCERMKHHVPVRRCMRTNICHYFSRDQPEIECGVNPDVLKKEAA